MLDYLDETIEAFFRATVPLGSAEVDVSFEPPDREWTAKLTRPTVNVFLWDIRRSATRSRVGLEEGQRDGVRYRRMALPVVELRYLITAWTSDHGDERALLGGLMGALLTHSQIPTEFLAPPLAGLRPPQIMMARSGEDHLDVFRALEGQLKPGINMIAVADVDTGAGLPLAPGVADVGVSLRDTRGTAASSRRRIAGEVAFEGAVGAIVSAPTDATKVNAAGRFLIRAEPGDEVVLELDPPMSVIVPESGGIRFG